MDFSFLNSYIPQGKVLALNTRSKFSSEGRELVRNFRGNFNDYQIVKFFYSSLAIGGMGYFHILPDGEVEAWKSPLLMFCLVAYLKDRSSISASQKFLLGKFSVRYRCQIPLVPGLSEILHKHQIKGFKLRG